MTRLTHIQKLPVFIILIAWTLVNLTPLGTMLLNSFKTTKEIFLKPFELPEVWRFSNFPEAWRAANFAGYFMNSIIVTISSFIAILCITSMAAYIIARYNFPGRRLIHFYVIAGLVLPIRLSIIPVFLLIRNIQLHDTLFGLFLIYTANLISFSTFVLISFFKIVPKELDDAARIDGAGFFRIYWQINLPLIRPALTTVSIMNIVYVWNDFFFPLIFIYSDSKKTIPLGIQNLFGVWQTQWHLLFAGLTIAIVPVIILFLILRKQFIAGLTQGAFK